MVAAVIPVPVYHVVLIGIDAYPQQPLKGCVDDALAVEAFLREAVAAGHLPCRLAITRLLAPHGAHADQDPALLPTRANILAALEALAGEQVQADHRVLIYYAGHGYEEAPHAGGAWHEGLVPHDLQVLSDVELNPLLARITARVADLTIVLDSCHAAGAVRDVDDEAALTIRRWGGRSRGDSLPGSGEGEQVIPPGHSPAGAERDPARACDGGARRGMWQDPDPPYLVVVACQADESAAEAQMEDGRRRGLFTYSLLARLRAVGGVRLADLRWGDLWAPLQDTVYQHGWQHRHVQHPMLIGRSERRVFGGPWERQDLGFALHDRPDGFGIDAGSLLGFSEGSLVAVYGPQPPVFPPLDSALDRQSRLGVLRVAQATPSTCIARAEGPAFALAPGARARLISGRGLLLRLALGDQALVEALSASPLLTLLPADAAGWEVEVREERGAWWIGDMVTPEIASVQAGEVAVLRAALESYARYNMVLQLVRNARRDPRLPDLLTVRLLDCNDARAVAQADPFNPRLPEVRRNAAGIHTLAYHGTFCITMSHAFSATLHVTVLDCTAGGSVEYLGDVIVRQADMQTIWRGGQHLEPFMVEPYDGVRGSIDRLVVVATTRPGADLHGLEVRETVMEVIERARQPMRDARITASPPLATEPAATGELWTALLIPLRIEPLESV
jgi:hypothetical protein